MAKKVKNKETVSEDGSYVDDMASVIAKNLNKQFKDLKVAYFLDSDNEAPTDVKQWVSTGNDILDLIISNRQFAGVPSSKIIEVVGWEASGKSLLSANLLANTQKMGGIAVFIDTESAVSQEYMTAIGVDLKTLVYSQMECVEDIFESIENIINTVRVSDNKQLITIVVDSIAGATTKTELESDYNKDGWATSKAIILSKAMRKITNLIARENILLVFTNQLRTNLGVTFGEKSTTSGGKAIAFHSSVRLRLKAVGKIKSGNDIIGISSTCTVIKNRVGPPLKKCEFDIYFDRGIDNYGSWFTILKEYKIIRQTGPSYYLTMEDETELKFSQKDFYKLVKEEKFKSYVYKLISDVLIMKYKTVIDEPTFDDLTDCLKEDGTIDENG